jgi:hypothetical protein
MSSRWIVFSVVIENTSGWLMNRRGWQVVAWLSRIRETSGTSERGLDWKMGRGECAGIRLGRLFIQPRRWSMSFAEQV